MNTIQQLTKIFSEFPGIGPRQAKRFVYYLLSRNGIYIEQLCSLLMELKKEISVCEECFRYFPQGRTVNSLCDICRSANRDVSQLMIVGRDVDFENIEKSHFWNGRYFILGGNVPILEKNPELKIRLNEMLIQVEKRGLNGLSEIVLGLSANPEGEYTGQYVRQALSSLCDKYKIKISVLGRGLSTGTELEYSYPDTIKNALLNRHQGNF
ncbi:MAG: toprim domain-containing protein [bacterium]